MNLHELIEPAAQAADAGGAGGGWIQFLFLGGFIAIFYFLLIRPQSKRRKEHQALVASLDKGDEVVTAGGVAGLVTNVDDDFVKVRIAPNVEIRVQKSSVGATLPKGTLKTLDEK
ncbi:MAG: preprotein translocase subunit YajC [Gammaproteobacteria bacterium]|nr:preprotein translocase subunit YajC [Gammaproteobacteria bacterium]